MKNGGKILNNLKNKKLRSSAVLKNGAIQDGGQNNGWSGDRSPLHHVFSGGLSPLRHVSLHLHIN